MHKMSQIPQAGMFGFKNEYIHTPHMHKHIKQQTHSKTSFTTLFTVTIYPLPFRWWKCLFWLKYILFEESERQWTLRWEVSLVKKPLWQISATFRTTNCRRQVRQTNIDRCILILFVWSPTKETYLCTCWAAPVLLGLDEKIYRSSTWHNKDSP